MHDTDFLNNYCQAILLHCGDVAILLDNNMKIIDMNSVAESAFNTAKKDAIGQDLFEVCRKNHSKLSFSAMELKQGKKLKNNFVDGFITYSQKQQRFMLWKKIIIDNKYFVLFGKDISALENAKRSRLLTTAHLRNIMENLPEYIYWKDVNLTYCGCNKHVSDYLNLPSPESIIGKTDRDFGWSEERINALREVDEKILKTGISSILEEVIPKPDKSQRIMLSSKTPLKDADNNIVGIVGISVDITDRKNAEQLKSEKEATEQVLRAVKMLAGCIAHEIRTPLAIISINTDNLYNEIVNLNQSEFSEQLHKEKNKINNIINNVKFAVRSASNVVDMLLIKIRSVFSEQAIDAEIEYDEIKSCINEAINEYPFYDNEREMVVWDSNSNKDFTYKGNNLLTKHILFNTDFHKT